MKNFQWAEPQTIEQVASFLSQEKGKIALMAGGTDLLGELKEGLAEPDVVVNLKSIPGLAYIKKEKDGVHIGALTTVVDLAEDTMIQQDYPGLHEAANVVASPQLRNVGTVGGNLCQRPRCWYYRDLASPCRKKGGSRCFAATGRNRYHAIFGGGLCHIVSPSDLAPALISLGAEVSLTSSKGARTILLSEFYILPSVNVRRENVLAADEILRELKIPLAKKGEKSTYIKLTERGAWDFAVVSAAVKGAVAGKSFSDIRIVMGGVAPVAWRLEKVETALKGKRINEALVRQALQNVLQEAKPLAENAYKKDLVQVAVTRAVMSLMS